MSQYPNGATERPDEPDLIDASCADCGAPCRAVADDEHPRCPVCHQWWCGEVVLGGLAVMQDRIRATRQQSAA